MYDHFSNVQEIIKESNNVIALRKPGELQFGVGYLDQALDGIAESDLVILGASTGAGKTELATHIALMNSAKKKNVLFVALETEHMEVPNRIKYRLFSSIYQNLPDYEKPFFGSLVSARNYYNNKLRGSFIDDLVDKKYAEDCETLQIIQRCEKEFFIDDLARITEKLHSTYDLIIIDHLNYFDFDTSVNENQALAEIMKRIRDMALIYKKPTVLVVHLRKKDNRSKAIVPSLDDIHGTSNIAKIATKIVLLSRRHTDEIVPGVYPTYFRVGKYRRDGSVTRYVAACNFVEKMNSYEKQFELGTLTFDESEFQPITTSKYLPSWVKPSQAGVL